ncbi:hypothetical protein [Actinoplanes sp. NPDC051851]|uniref:hypothetical protein n=1 Tax=Actinoplanes sp. NPDC051851 TaxID=3154753 RepID=UPI00342E4A01
MSEPVRFEMRMKPGFGAEYTREQVVGSRVRHPVGPAAGVIVDWLDEDDGGVTLIVEQRLR